MYPTAAQGQPKIWLVLYWKSLVFFVFLAGAAACIICTGQLVGGWLEGMTPSRTPSGAMLYLGVVMALSMAGTPRQVLSMVGGHAFGAFGGCFLATAGLTAGCVLLFYLSRGLGGNILSRRPGTRLGARLKTLETAFAANTFTGTLMLRLCPVGNNAVLNIAAGLTRVSAPRFFAASALGYIPQNLAFSLLGSGVSVSDGCRVALSLGLFLAATILGAVLYSRSKMR